MKRVIHTPGLSAVRFTGTFNKKLFELGGRVQPLLNPDDENIVIVTELQARLLSKTAHFEKVDLDELFANEKITDEQTESKENSDIKENLTTDEKTGIDEQTGKDESKEVFVEDLTDISLGDLKVLCKKFNITVGNKKNDVLKALVLPYLKNRE